MTEQNRPTAHPRIEAFAYPAIAAEPFVPVWDGGPESTAAAAPAEPSADALCAEFDRRMVEETRRSFAAGREKGREEGRAQEREAQAAANAQADERRVRLAAELTERFAEARKSYFEEVEQEVVELALAVAARILRREAQMDPLLLTGAVRVALGQLAPSPGIALKVPESELDLWTETVSLMPNLKVRPRVEAGEGMRLGDCAIATEQGSVDLGIRAQMAEIERGFFDRAGGRRAATAPAEPGKEQNP